MIPRARPSSPRLPNIERKRQEFLLLNRIVFVCKSLHSGECVREFRGCNTSWTRHDLLSLRQGRHYENDRVRRSFYQKP